MTVSAMPEFQEFIIIVITAPDFVDEESEKIAALFEAGVDIIHIRKPEWSIDDVRRLIEDIPCRYRSRLRLHGHFALVSEMNLGGVHLNRRNPKAPLSVKAVSKSCHSIQEVIDSQGTDYVTLSPVFDSISKQGYASKFCHEKIGEKTRGHKVVALGGVTAEKLMTVRQKGFSGAALLGYIWSEDFWQKLDSIKDSIYHVKHHVAL